MGQTVLEQCLSFLLVLGHTLQRYTTWLQNSTRKHELTLNNTLNTRRSQEDAAACLEC